MHYFLFQLILFFGLATNLAQAKDFGQLNQVFPIKEERFLDWIQKRLAALDWEKVKEKWRSEMRKQIESPKPMVVLGQVVNFQRKVLDLSFDLPEDIISASGTILVAKGYKINPAKELKMQEKIFFLDSRNEKQVEWFKRQELEASDLVVLVAGKPFQLQRELGRKVYFDQTGELAKKFSLRATPSVVRQIEEEVVLDEYPLDVDLKKQ